MTTRRPLVLLGDSLIEFGEWSRFFPGQNIMNLGLAGETVQELRERLLRLASRLENPGCILLMIGTNNVATEEYGFLPAYREIVANLRSHYPVTPIMVNSLLPLQLPWLAPDTIPRLNERLRQIAGEFGAGYVDAYEAFREAGRSKTLFFEDKVHLTDDGYAIWAAAIAPLLPSAEASA